MKKMTNTFTPGLENIIVTETEISILDTVNERIVIRGHELIELSNDHNYLDVIHLLLEHQLPDKEAWDQVADTMISQQEIPKELFESLQFLSQRFHPMDAQRTGISLLANYDPNLEDRSISANKARAYSLLAKLPNLTANVFRILQNQERIVPRDDLSYSGNFLYMITGNVPTELEESIFDTLLLLYSEHEMPNSTFTARVIASTNSDLFSALTGAIGSLKGNLHGGANEAVMHMLREANTVEQFEKQLHEKLANKEKIMGFGHRVYMRKMDPRATVVKNALRKLSELDGDDLYLQMCEAGEKIMEKEKGLYPNLDYYAAPVYWKLNIPIPLYTPIFFSARTAGLCAHIMEQHENNRIFRPRVKYIGKQYAKKQ